MVKISEFDSKGNEHLIDGLLLDHNYPQLVDKNILKIGDIIFCYANPDNEAKIKDKLKTKAIQKATKGIYVHCALYLGDDLVADSVSGGVRHENLDAFESNYDYLVICRCQYLNDEHIIKMVEYAQNCKNQEMKYDMSGAVKLANIRKSHLKNIYGESGKQALNKKDNNKSFCSEFIINCLKASGYIPWEDSFYVSHAFSPTDLAHNEILSFQGFISKVGLNAIDSRDIFKK